MIPERIIFVSRGITVIHSLLDWGGCVCGEVREKFVSKAVGENGDGLDV